MRAVRHHLARAVLLQRRRRRTQGAGGVDDVVDEHADAILHVADDVHHRGLVRTRPALVDDRQVRVVQAFGQRPCPRHATDVRTDHDQVAAAVTAPDVGQQNGRRVYIVHRDIEKSLDLVGVQIHRQHLIGTDRADHRRRHLGRDRHAARTRAPVLAGVAEIRDHRGHAGRRGALERIHHHQQFHEVVRGRRRCRLDHEHFLAPHVFFDLDLRLAVGKTADQGLAQRHVQLMANRLCQRAIRVAAEYQQAALLALAFACVVAGETR